MNFAEQAVCGSILIDAACLEPLRGIVSAEDFLSPTGRALFQAACSLADDGQTR